MCKLHYDVDDDDDDDDDDSIVKTRGGLELALAENDGFLKCPTCLK